MEPSQNFYLSLVVLFFLGFLGFLDLELLEKDDFLVEMGVRTGKGNMLISSRS